MVSWDRFDQVLECTEGVLSCSFNGNDENLVCASDGRDEARVWDVRTLKAVRRVGPRKPRAEDDSVNGMRFNDSGVNFPFQVFVTCQHGIELYDLRKEEVVLERLDCRVDLGIDGNEELNDIDVHGDGLHVVAADDDGYVRLFEFNGGKKKDEGHLLGSWTTTTCNSTTAQNEEGEEEGLANIVSSVVFRAQGRWDQFISGGFDCNIALWEGADLQDEFEIDPYYGDHQDGDIAAGIMLNPPFVHSIDVARTKERYAFGLGDHSVLIRSFSSEQQDNDDDGNCERFQANDANVICVKFFKDDTMLFTAGNDCVVNLYSLEKEEYDGENNEKIMQRRWSLKVDKMKINSLAVSVNSGRRLAIATTQNLIIHSFEQ